MRARHLAAATTAAVAAGWSAALCCAAESAADGGSSYAAAAGPADASLGAAGWGPAAMAHYARKAADDAWHHVLSEGVSGQVTVVLMAGICCWLLGHMVRRPRTSCALLLTWLGWVAWSVHTARLTWETMEERGYNVYTRTHLCAPPPPLSLGSQHPVETVADRRPFDALPLHLNAGRGGRSLAGIV
jgi:hypothetical protein